tara:strand:- start:3613 stop:4287 length:675 start_codon:yes stop_codon:yes gene_type:complete
MIISRNDDGFMPLNTSFEMRRLYDVEDKELYSVESGSCFSSANGEVFPISGPLMSGVTEESILGIGKRLENFDITGIQIFEDKSSTNNFKLDDENSHFDFIGLNFGVLNTDIILPQQGAEITAINGNKVYAAIQYGLEDNDCRLKVSYKLSDSFIMDIFEGVVSDEQDHLLYRLSTEEGDFIEHKLTEIDEEFQLEDNERALAIINFNQNSIIPSSSFQSFIFP